METYVCIYLKQCSSLQASPLTVTVFGRPKSVTVTGIFINIFPVISGVRVLWNARVRPDARRGGKQETFPPDIMGKILQKASFVFASDRSLKVCYDQSLANTKLA